MQDKPNLDELLEAVSEFLMKEIFPLVKDNEELSYKTLVSWNTLQILAREWKLAEELMNEDISRLANYLQKENSSQQITFLQKKQVWKNLNQEFSKIIREKKISEPTSKEWKLVKQSLEAKLQISNPKFL